MSTTNRAFIKAFRHDAAQPAGAAAPPALAAEHAAVRVAHGSHDLALGAVSARPAVGHVARSGDRPQHVGDRPQHAAATAGEKRPLSSFIPQTQVAAVGGDSEQSDFQPGTTIASFQWPLVCRTLVQQSSMQLDNVVRLLMARAGVGNSLIGVLGLFPRIGATTTALCLASRAAARGRRVILGDANFRSPRLASLVDAVPTAGWEEVLKHSAPLSDAVIHATDDNLDLLALGNRLVKDPQPMVGGLQAAVTAGVLRHAYDLSILDVGAFFDPMSQPVLLELVSNLGVDAVVAIAGPGPADRRDLATVVEYLDRSGCELLGVIENRVAKPKAA